MLPGETLSLWCEESSMAWNLAGSYVETCSCELMCPCNLTFTHGATYDFCRVVLAFDISAGTVDGTDVGGARGWGTPATPKGRTDPACGWGCSAAAARPAGQFTRLVAAFAGH